MKTFKNNEIRERQGENDPPDELPSQDSFYARPNVGRRTLTPRDIARNEGVDRLFASATRGLPIDADPRETRADPQTMAHCVEAVLKRLGIEQSPWINQLTEAWPKLVSPDVAKDAYPGKWDSTRGILFIYVKSSVRLFEIRRTHLRTIEAAIRAFAPEVKIRQIRLMQNV